MGYNSKYYPSPRWSTEIADCSMPMTFDTYDKCSYKCLYCFAQFQKAIGQNKDFYFSKGVRHVNPQKIKDLFLGNPTTKALSQFKPYIAREKTMQWGGLSDPFDGYEQQHGVTLELLRFFKDIEYPLCFSTKATWWTEDERYIELFKGQKNWNVKFSIITKEEDKAKIIEKGVPAPLDRLQAIERVANWDCGGATLRLRPFIIGISTPSYLELIEDAHQRGATALSTEFFCVEQRSRQLKENMHIFNEMCGFDLLDFYKKYSISSGYLRLNRKVKKPFITEMKSLCDRLGMRFYVSDAHFKELCHNGSCCGLPPTWNYSKGQWCEALQIAKKKGFVTFSDVEPEIRLFLDGFEFQYATGFNTGGTEKRMKFRGMSMADYMRWLWNNPQNGQSPYTLFEGILVPGEKDSDGNLIYKYSDIS